MADSVSADPVSTTAKADVHANVFAAFSTADTAGDALRARHRSREQLMPPPNPGDGRYRLHGVSETTVNVLKCVSAYAVGSLFTFVPSLSDFLGTPWDIDGPVRNAHLVATVAVYFSPGRTLGAMIETDLYLLLAAVYALILMAGSLATAVTLESFGASVRSSRSLRHGLRRRAN